MAKQHALAGFDYYNAVIESEELSNTEKIVALGIRRHWNPDKKKHPCYVSKARLAKYAHVRERSVSRALRTLEERGWITTTMRTGQTNVYDIAIPYAARLGDLGDPPDLGDISTPDMAPTDLSPHPRHQRQGSDDTQVTPPLTRVSPRTDTRNINLQQKREQTQQNTEQGPAKARIKIVRSTPSLGVGTQAHLGSTSVFEGKTAEQIITGPWPYSLQDGTRLASTQGHISSAESLDSTSSPVVNLTPEQRRQWIDWFCSLAGLPATENLREAAEWYFEESQGGKVAFKPDSHLLWSHERSFRAFMAHARDRSTYRRALRRADRL